MNDQDLATKKDLADGLTALENKLSAEFAVINKRIDGLASKKELAETNKRMDELASKKDLAETNAGLAQTNKKLDEHTKKLDEHTKKLDEHTKKLDEHTKKLEKANDRLDRLYVVVLQNSDDIKSMQKTLQKVEHKQDMFMEVLTEFAGEMKDFRQERAAANASFFRHDDQLQDHERRIVALEDKITP